MYRERERVREKERKRERFVLFLTLAGGTYWHSNLLPFYSTCPSNPFLMIHPGIESSCNVISRERTVHERRVQGRRAKLGLVVPVE